MALRHSFHPIPCGSHDRRAINFARVHIAIIEFGQRIVAGTLPAMLPSSIDDTLTYYIFYAGS